VQKKAKTDDPLLKETVMILHDMIESAAEYIVMSTVQLFNV
jgi:hypothetical protein